MSRVLITGGNGFLGRGVVAALAGAQHEAETVHHGPPVPPPVTLVVCADLRIPQAPLPNVVYEICDVTDAERLESLMREHRINTVVHLASIVNPGKSTTPEMERRIDIDGSRNVLDACLATDVKRLVVSSSGAAYGYHADNPQWLREEDALRGNDEFTYSQHKRIVEEMLAEARDGHPELEQVVFRIGTILGETVDNQITALFEKKRLLRVAGSESPFVFAWDTDVVGAMVRAVTGSPAGVFNVAGDGAVTVHEIAAALGKGVSTLPAWLLRAALWLGHLVGATPHTAARVVFLQYRPVLANDRLKNEFGYTPRYTSREAFEAWVAARERSGRSARDHTR